MVDAVSLLRTALNLDNEGVGWEQRLKAWKAVRAAFPRSDPLPSLALAEILLEAGQLDQAILQLTPGLNPWLVADHADLACKRAEYYDQRCQPLEAIAAWQQAVALRPDAVGFCNLGVALKKIWHLEEAEAAFRKALDLNPNHVLSWCNLGHLLSNRDSVDAARAAYDQALKIDPHSAMALWHRSFTSLRLVYDSCDEVMHRRQTYAKDLTDLAVTLQTFPATRRQEFVKAVGERQPFLLAYQGYDDLALQEQYGDLVFSIMTQAWPDYAVRPPMPPLDSDGRWRIGFVSAHFYRHSVWQAVTRGWLQELDRSRFKPIGYCLNACIDDQTQHAQRLCEIWHEGLHTTDRWITRITGDRPHLLIYPEIGMDAQSARLSALRLAPVQCVGWGHPETTGFPSIDAYISGDLLEPKNGANHYREKLIRLPRLGCSYPRIDKTAAPPLSRAALGLDPDRLYLLACQTPQKYHPAYDRLLARIVTALPNAQLLFFQDQIHHVLSVRLAERLDCALRAEGSSFVASAQFLPYMPQERFFSLLRQADLYLDTPGFSGFNTAMQALEAGLPVVTLEGKFMRSRFASALLQQIGVTDTIATDLQAYERIALTLGQQSAARENLRARLLKRVCLAQNDRASAAALNPALIALLEQASAR